jgi:hypothetical protein
LIQKAHKFFIDRFEGQYQQLSPEEAFRWALRIQAILTRHVSVVVAIAIDEESAHNVFETLNDRGIGVAPEDLIRNFLTLRVEPSWREEVERDFEIVWGLEPDVKLEEFLRHYWVSYHGDIRSRSLYREIRTTVIKEVSDPAGLAHNLARLSDVYGDIVDARHDSPGLQSQLEAVVVLRAFSLIPAILSALDVVGDVDPEPVERFLKSLVAMYVRHNLIGNLESSRLEDIVFELAPQIRVDGDLNSAVQKIVDFAPNDEQFKLSFAMAEVRRSNVARYLLHALELERHSTDELDVAPVSRVNLEHVYPRSPQPEHRSADMDAMVHRIGNMTILSTGLNTRAKNRPFEEKRPYYAQSEILLTCELAVETKFPDWNAEAVTERSLELASAAAKVWSFPKN